MEGKRNYNFNTDINAYKNTCIYLHFYPFRGAKYLYSQWYNICIHVHAYVWVGVTVSGCVCMVLG